MSNIAGVRIHPGFFNRKRVVTERRVGADPGGSFKLKKTATIRPRSPKGKYAMPVIAVVLAVVSVAGAATAVGAVIAGAAITASTVFAVVAAVGAVTAAVGAVTGNQKLIKIGGIIGLVGGIGSFAAGSGMFGGGDLSGGGTTAGGAASEIATGGAGSEEIGAGMIADAGQTGIPTVGQTGIPTTSQTVTDSVANAAGTIDSTPLPVTTPSPLVDLPTPTVGVTPLADTVPKEMNGLNPEPLGSSITPKSGTSIIPGAPERSMFDSMMTTFDKFGKFTKENPGLTSQLLQGISSAADPSQRDAREASANLANQQSATLEQQRRNMTGAVAEIDWGKVFKQPFGAKPTVGSGMISRAGGG